MSREKQIDEIAKLICNYPQCLNYNIIGECAKAECVIKDKAEALYNAGYRKQSEECKKKIVNQREELRRLNKTITDLTRSRDTWKKQAERVGKQLHEVLNKQSEWISVDERLPEAEKEVIILAVRRYMCFGEVREVTTITTAMYENGTMSTEDSEWNWHDIDFIYDEENDIQYIPEGWWEFRHYNPDDVYNNAVDDKVTHWMPLPEAPKMKGGAE